MSALLNSKQVNEMIAASDKRRQERAEHLPTSALCAVAMVQIVERLREIGWKSSDYAPKNRPFKAILIGSTGVFTCLWLGGATGGFFCEDTNDYWPAKILVWCESDEVLI